MGTGADAAMAKRIALLNSCQPSNPTLAMGNGDCSTRRDMKNSRYCAFSVPIWGISPRAASSPVHDSINKAAHHHL